MQNFEERYKKLNAEQKKAVDTIYGSVLVVAGPGSGKTELLSMRVANILKKTDTDFSSILCLTFTDAAAENMRERLSKLIGEEAYKINIHTFHSFGSEIINQNPEYFYNAAKVEPVDRLTKIEIIENALEKFPHNSDLNKYHPKFGYTYLKDIIAKISELKQAAISSDEFKKILDKTEDFLKKANTLIVEVFKNRLNKETKEKVKTLLVELDALESNDKKIKQELISSLYESYTEDKLSKWKNSELKTDPKGEKILKDLLNINKLKELAQVYKQYQESLDQQGLFDFSDMLLDTAIVLEENASLRADLMEKYQFILVDEFQDTNGVQMRLLHSITNENSNIMAVGDDDQSIYKFQGAKIENITEFYKHYNATEIITLTKNYRSSQEILDSARALIKKGSLRLENILENISKDLSAENPSIKTGEISKLVFPDKIQEFNWILEKIQSLENLKGTAVISKTHQNLEELANILIKNNIPVTYDRKKDILQIQTVQELLKMLVFTASLYGKNKEISEELLPEILSYEFLELDRIEIWKISKKANENKQSWLDIILNSEDKKLKEIIEFFIALSVEAQTKPVEEIIDKITQFKFKDYYFSLNQLEENPNKYLEHLSAMQKLYSSIRDYKKNINIKLKDLITFFQVHKKHSLKIYDSRKLDQGEDSVQLITAHSAKGLEFETVFILDLNDRSWSAQGGAKSKLSFPKNLKISPEKDNEDDILRLFFVAITRAKSNLYLTRHEHKEDGKKLSAFRYLESIKGEEEKIEKHISKQQLINEIDQFKSFEIKANEKDLLAELLTNYKLAVTHLNNFLDITEGGPNYFLTQNLLRFPQKQSIANIYGSAIHYAIEKFHNISKIRREKAQLQDLNQAFLDYINKQRISKEDLEKYSKKGIDNLKIFFEKRVPKIDFSGFSEFNFRSQNITLNEKAKITGALDRIEIDEKNKELTLVDYKTGKALKNWNTNSQDIAIKKWKYRNQLVFYILLVENSAKFGKNYKIKQSQLEFVTADKVKEMTTLALSVNREEIDRMKRLVIAVWEKIINLDFPDIEKYSKDIKGIIAFEEDLLNNINT